MFFIKNSFFVGLLLGCVFADSWVFKYKDQTVYEQDFYNYIPKHDWVELKDNKQRESLLFDFIKQSAAVYEANLLGLNLSPAVHEKLLGRFERLLVNEYYMRVFLGSVVPDNGLAFCKKNLGKAVLVNHILLKKTDQPLASSLLDSLEGGSNFGDLAFTLSKDPSAKQNKGNLGWITVGQTVPDFQDVVFELCVGCVGIVESDFGIHVVRVDSTKSSFYSNLEKEEYNDFAFRFATGYIKEPLKNLAAEHDSSLLVDNGVVFNYSLLSSFIEDIKVEVGGDSREKVDFIGGLQTLGGVVLLNGEVLSGQWFANVFSGPFYKSVFFDSTDSLVDEFKLILLRKIVGGLAIKEGVDLSYSFKKQFSSIKNELLKKEYLKFLINSVPPPSKEDIEVYYYQNEAELFVNKKTGEPFGLVSSYGSVEAILLKEKQEEVQSKFFNSLSGDLVVLNKRWLYVD